MSIDVFYTALSGIALPLLRRLAAPFARFRERRAVISLLSTMTDRELSDIGLSRAEILAVFDREATQAPDIRSPAADDAEEQVLADLGLSRRFPFSAAGH